MGVRADYQVLEYFSGLARITQLSQHAGYNAVAFDLDYGVARATKSGRKNSMNLNGNAGLVLAIRLILRGRLDEVIAVFAVCCSSWVPVNRGTGKRDLLVPEGNESIASVRKANKLLSRTR